MLARPIAERHGNPRESISAPVDQGQKSAVKRADGEMILNDDALPRYSGSLPQHGDGFTSVMKNIHQRHHINCPSGARQPPSVEEHGGDLRRRITDYLCPKNRDVRPRRTDEAAEMSVAAADIENRGSVGEKPSDVAG